MEPVESEKVLRALVYFLEREEPVPLSWAIEYADRFAEAWRSSTEPQLLLQIAASSVPRRTLVRAAVAVARTVLPHATKTFHAALELTDDWVHLRMKVTDQRMQRLIRKLGEEWLSRQGYNDDDDSEEASRARYADASVKAAIDTAENDLSPSYLGLVASSGTIDALNAGANQQDLVRIVHENIPAPTIDDIVAAKPA